MAPIDLTAAVAATLFARKLAEELGGQTGRSIWAGLGRLVEFVRARLSGNPKDRAALDRVEAAPGDRHAVSTLAEVLRVRAAEDPSFGDQLADIVADARHDPMIASFVTEISDNARVGKLVNFGVVHGDVSL